jgi:hypothetical protein
MPALLNYPKIHNTNLQPVLPASRLSPPLSRRVSPLREGTRIRKRGLFLGMNPDGQPVYLSAKHLRTHLHIIGPTGQGKSRLLLFLFQLMCSTNRPIILVDPKGDLYQQARDWCIINGFARRLVLFDLSSNVIPGYNPLRQNGLRIDLQAQWVREGVKSAWGADSFDSTPLLARMLYLCLYAARALNVSLMESLDVLRPTPTLRQRALMEVRDPFVHSALLAFDNLSDRVKAEQSNSTINRLEMFLCDQTVRQVICSPTSIDTEQILTERKIWLINAAKYQPLLADQIKLLLRFLTNDILAHVFKGHGEGRFNENNPVYYIADEFQNAATSQMATALDEGRGAGLHCILAHQHLSQLADEDTSGYLLRSCMNDARTKIIFGGLDYQDLEVFANNLLLQHYDPHAIKHILRTPSYRPVETVRKVPTYSTSKAYSRSVTDSFSEADSISHSVQHSSSRGSSVADSVALTEGTQESYTRGINSSITESRNWGRSESLSGATTRSQAHTNGTAVGQGYTHASGRSNGSTDSSGRSSASGWSQNDSRQSTIRSGDGQTMLPPVEHLLYTEDPEVMGLSSHTGTSEGQSSSYGTNGMVGTSTGHARSSMVSDSDSASTNTSISSADTSGISTTDGWGTSWNEGYGIAQQSGQNEAWSYGNNRSTTRGKTVTNSESVTDGYSDTAGHTTTHGIAFTEGETITHGESFTLSPFYEYVREEIEAPTFLTPEEQKLLIMKKLARIPKQHFLVKAPESSDCVVRAPYVPDPTITKRRLAAGLQTVYSTLPCYTTLAQHTNEIAPHGAGNVVRYGDDDIDVIDVKADEVRTTEHAPALPSPAADDEAALWERWHAMGRGRVPRQEKK